MSEHRWEVPKVGDSEYGILKIVGGWIVSVQSSFTSRSFWQAGAAGGLGLGCTFIADPTHENKPLPL